MLISGSVEENRFREGQYELRIGRIDWLADVSDSVVETITVTVNTDALGKDDVEMLASHIKQEEGKTALRVVFVDATNPHNRLHMTSRTYRVKVTRQLLDDIENSEALSCSLN